jgi:ribosomal protein S19E (S16A)
MAMEREVVPIPSHGWFIIQAASVFRHLGFVEILKILKQTVSDVLVLD